MKKSEEMEELNVEKFNPTLAEIQRVVKEASAVEVTDLADYQQLKVVKEHRIALRDIRVAITKQGKEFRQKALDFQRAVIAKEKDLIALVEPEEERLAGIEEAADKEKELAARRVFLPKRKERLEAIGDGIEISDDEILAMEGSEFEGYFNARLAAKNEKARQELEAKERALKAEQEKLDREKEMRAREEAARQEERDRAAQAEKDRIAREELAAKQKAEREAREKAQAEADAKAQAEAKKRVEKEEKARLARNKKYQEFLSSHGWTKENAGDFHVLANGNVHTLYKKVGEIEL